MLFAKIFELLKTATRASVLLFALVTAALPTQLQGLVPLAEAAEGDSEGESSESEVVLAVSVEQAARLRLAAKRLPPGESALSPRQRPTIRSRPAAAGSWCDSHNGCGAALRC